MSRDDDEVDMYISPRMLAGQTPNAKISMSKAHEQAEAQDTSQNSKEVPPALQSVLNNPSLMGEGEPAYFYDTGQKDAPVNERPFGNILPQTKCGLTYRVIFSAILLLLGCALIAFGSWMLLETSTAFEAYLEAEGQLLRRRSILTGIILTGGILLFLTGALGLGILIFRAGSRRKQKIVFYVTEGLIFLAFLLSAGLLCISILALVQSASKRNSLGEAGWLHLVEEAPNRACIYETEFGCSGFLQDQCRASTSNATIRSFCPGHFCTDQCRVLSSNPSKLGECQHCTSTRRAFDYPACKVWESRNSGQTGCDKSIRDEIVVVFTILLVLSVASCSWIMFSTIVTAIRLCTERRRHRDV